MLQGLLALLLLALPVAAAAAMPALEHCESEMNKIKDLLQVSCVDKGLTSIPAGLPKDTGILLLGSNHLAQVTTASFQHLQQLSELDLSNNSLEALETSTPLPKLQQLLLPRNRLESLPAFQGLPGLKRLALGYNNISQLPEGGFRDLGQLRDLELQGNRLQNLPAGAFQGLGEMRDLDLSENLLEALPPDLLAELPNLEILRLERNRLQRVPAGFFSEEASYAYVYLAGNPWLCDCQLLYLRDWIIDNEISIYTRTSVEEHGSEKVVTENEPESVRCHAPHTEQGQPVMHFQPVCKKSADYEETEGGEDTAGGTGHLVPTPSTPLLLSTATVPLTPLLPVPSSASSQSPSTAMPLTGASPTSTTNASAGSPTTTYSPTTTSHIPSTTISGLTATPAMAPSKLSTTGVTVGRSTATIVGRSTLPPTTPGSSTTLTIPASPSKSFSAPTRPTASSAAPFAHRATAWMLTAPLPQSRPPPTMTEARPLPGTAALLPSSTPVQSSARASAAPVPTRSFSPPAASEPSAHCLCPALPVRVLGAATQKGSPAGWLAGYCCLLRLTMYVACLALVALPTLALLCWLGWVYLSWYRPALQGAPGERLVRYQQWQKVAPKEWQVPSPTTGPRNYRVCKKFRIGPSRHITWLLVSLPGSGREWPWEQRKDSLSSYSLDRGRDTIGAVRVKYAAASL